MYNVPPGYLAIKKIIQVKIIYFSKNNKTLRKLFTNNVLLCILINNSWKIKTSIEEESYVNKKN